MDDPFSLIVAGIEELRRQRIDPPSYVMITNHRVLKVLRSYILNRNDPTTFGRKRRKRRNRGRLIERRQAHG